MSVEWMRDRINEAEREGEVIAITGPRSLSSPGPDNPANDEAIRWDIEPPSVKPRRKGHDPVHTFRAPAELVSAVRGYAWDAGESLSDIVRRALEEYLSEIQRRDV